MEKLTIKQLIEFIKTNMKGLDHASDKDAFLLDHTPIELLLLANSIDCHLNR